MSLITCSAKCKYQKEGYCSLDTPSNVTNTNNIGCAHFVEISEKQDTDNAIVVGEVNIDEFTSPPQRLL